MPEWRDGRVVCHEECAREFGDLWEVWTSEGRTYWSGSGREGAHVLRDRLDDNLVLEQPLPRAGIFSELGFETATGVTAHQLLEAAAPPWAAGLAHLHTRLNELRADVEERLNALLARLEELEAQRARQRRATLANGTVLGGFEA